MRTTSSERALGFLFQRRGHARRRASSGSRFRVDPPSRVPTRVRSRRRLAPFASALARRRPRGKRDDDDDGPQGDRPIGRSIDRPARTMRTNDANDAPGRTTRTNERRSALPRSIAPTHARTDARTHGRNRRRRSFGSSESPTRTTRRVRSSRVTGRGSGPMVTERRDRDRSHPTG